MKVSELITRLQDFPPDQEVVVGWGYCEELIPDFEIRESEVLGEYDFGTKQYKKYMAIQLG